MIIDFIQNQKIRVNIKMPSGRKGIATFIGHKDGSCFINCSKKFLKAEKYRFGVITVPAGITKLSEYKMTPENGFIETTKEPKMSFHPDGYIHASLSTPKDSKYSRRIKMDSPLGSIGGKTIATLEWENLSEFETVTETKNGYHTLTINVPKDINYLYGLLKASYNLEDLIGEPGSYRMVDKGEMTDGIGKMFFDDEFMSNLKDGHFAILKKPILDKSRKVVLNEKGIKKEATKNPLMGLLWGIKDNRVNKGKIIWYLLTFLHPDDSKREFENKNGTFIFSGAMKNWESDRTRETGEKVIIWGKKY